MPEPFLSPEAAQAAYVPPAATRSGGKFFARLTSDAVVANSVTGADVSGLTLHLPVGNYEIRGVLYFAGHADDDAKIEWSVESAFAGGYFTAIGLGIAATTATNSVLMSALAWSGSASVGLVTGSVVAVPIVGRFDTALPGTLVPKISKRVASGNATSVKSFSFLVAETL